MTKVLWKTLLVNQETAEQMAEVVEIPVRVARWLCARGIDIEQAKQWLRLDGDCLTSPWTFVDMHAAVERILKGIGAQERIAVIGDYDVDGVTASSILCSALSSLDADWLCDIPHRIKDGYGLSEEIVHRVKEQGATLLVTVDNGIRSMDAVAAAMELGMDVIVTDHHEPGDDVPASATALVHWRRTVHQADVSYLSGAGVALKLSEALLATGIETQLVSSEAIEDLLPWLKGLASLGALADVMPMSPENRLLIREGLAALRVSHHPGWRSLCATAGVKQEELTDRTALWRITPRLNAAGRMDSAALAFRLLMSTDALEATQLAEQIETLNNQRRLETDKAFRAAQEQCSQHFSGHAAGYVVAGPWPQGVVGIVAARLVDIYQKPVIVLADNGDGTMKGSGRAPEGTSLYRLTQQCQAYLTHFGGHDGAIGCGLDADNLTGFQRAFNQACQQTVDTEATAALEEREHRLMPADDFLPLAQANLETVEWAELFAPYGPGNPPLCFYMGPLKVESVAMVGKGNQHVRLSASEGGARRDMIWFNAPDWIRGIHPGEQISAVVELELNTWRQNRSAQIRVVDARRLVRPLTRQHFGLLYKFLRARRKLLVEEAAEVLPDAMADEIRLILDAFVELGFAHCQESAYHVVERADVRDLRESRHYHDHLQRAIGLSL
ncbi:single-stranded-DNA-specific exonuclease RecJ [Alicyclobacillus sp. SO9]|uniref:single-stranded-DNA-specific exonuclease RecJ n=1 Tax=Alicyclobacillus sp. SO9 TaxID=2665646 RepID=UPI0018E88EF9|nr:single-stranded-DNA-specific exonuclease RecJ [Alicyclobacillus sp. SO9]QQE77450.1 single-stranded-DNA-specific exonuclease RecJ [Alicyclobacillus sp. SO9]